MKALVGAFNQEKALVGAFSVIVKTENHNCGTDGSICGTTNYVFGWCKLWSTPVVEPMDRFAALHVTPHSRSDWPGLAARPVPGAAVPAGQLPALPPPRQGGQVRALRALQGGGGLHGEQAG